MPRLMKVLFGPPIESSWAFLFNIGKCLPPPLNVANQKLLSMSNSVQFCNKWSNHSVLPDLHPWASDKCSTDSFSGDKQKSKKASQVTFSATVWFLHRWREQLGQSHRLDRACSSGSSRGFSSTFHKAMGCAQCPVCCGPPRVSWHHGCRRNINVKQKIPLDFDNVLHHQIADKQNWKIFLSTKWYYFSFWILFFSWLGQL